MKLLTIFFLCYAYIVQTLLTRK